MSRKKKDWIGENELDDSTLNSLHQQLNSTVGGLSSASVNNELLSSNHNIKDSQFTQTNPTISNELALALKGHDLNLNAKFRQADIVSTSNDNIRSEVPVPTKTIKHLVPNCQKLSDQSFYKIATFQTIIDVDKQEDAKKILNNVTAYIEFLIGKKQAILNKDANKGAVQSLDQQLSNVIVSSNNILSDSIAEGKVAKQKIDLNAHLIQNEEITSFIPTNLLNDNNGAVDLDFGSSNNFNETVPTTIQNQNINQINTEPTFENNNDNEFNITNFQVDSGFKISDFDKDVYDPFDSSTSHLAEKPSVIPSVTTKSTDLSPNNKVIESAMEGKDIKSDIALKPDLNPNYPEFVTQNIDQKLNKNESVQNIDNIIDSLQEHIDAIDEPDTLDQYDEDSMVYTSETDLFVDETQQDPQEVVDGKPDAQKQKYYLANFNDPSSSKLNPDDFYPEVEKQDSFYQAIRAAGYTTTSRDYSVLTRSEIKFDPQNTNHATLIVQQGFEFLLNDPTWQHEVTSKLSMAMHKPLELNFKISPILPLNSPKAHSQSLYLQEIERQRKKLHKIKGLDKLLQSLNENLDNLNIEIIK